MRLWKNKQYSTWNKIDTMLCTHVSNTKYGIHHVDGIDRLFPENGKKMNEKRNEQTKTKSIEKWTQFILAIVYQLR